MNQNESIKQTILNLMISNPIVSTSHVARYFTHRGSPYKRASEALLKLEREKVIEGRRRAMGTHKVWRLTKRGREEYGVTRPPTPFTSNKINHFLAITTVYQDLRRMGELKRWQVELRESFGKHKYCPDCFFVLVKEGQVYAYLCEVQESPLSSERWKKKWARTEAFFSSPEFNNASFQVIKGRVIRPKILVLSKQQESTIREGCSLPLVIAQDIRKATL